MSNLDTFLEFKVFLNLFPLNNFAQLLKGISKNLRLKKFNLPIPCLNAKIVQNLWVTVPTYLSSHTYVKKTRKHSILQKFMKQTESRTRIAIYFLKVIYASTWKNASSMSISNIFHTLYICYVCERCKGSQKRPSTTIICNEPIYIGDLIGKVKCC